MLELAAIALVSAITWFIWDSLKAREAANAAIRPACRAVGLLFLDDTVALERIRPARDEDGRMRVERVYRFDYSDTGDNRRRGHVALLGARVLNVDLGGGGGGSPPP
ncbi:MAG: DUF3301 domain-containing protein [Burkholderiales bacterium]|nr:DUF3301 domain-containing protein [Burkholderiales bacterium]